jgi:outer membrane translocation and assembly module TamA
MFGRSVRYANVEARRWLNIGSPIRLGAAVFADAAERSGGSAWRPGRRVLADVGGGVRFKLPGRDGILRIDLGYGLRDRAHAVTFGWTTP